MSRLETNQRIAAICRSQFGYISRAQARAAGLSDRQIELRIQRTEWLRVHQSVYRLAVIADSWSGQLLGACIHTGGVASHRCAAALWRLDLFSAPPLEVTVDKPKRSLHIVRLHQSTQWHLRDETIRSGIPCTGIERTLLDCAAVVSFHKLERLCEDAIRRKLTTWQDLTECLQRHSRQGRNGCGPMRRLLEWRIEDETIPLSDFSRLIVHLLESYGVPKPVVEYRITDADGRFIMQTDLAWPAHKKCWELDGLKFHSGRTAMERDKRKRNSAKTAGWNIQEILWSMYIDHPNELVDMARKFLAS